MININLMDDDELRGTINSFISALLPHDNFDPTMFATVLETIYKYVHLDEFKLEHRLILETLSDLNRIKISVSSFEPRLTRDVFEHILEAGIMDAIVRPDLGVTSWLSYEGMNTNLSIQTVREEACQHLCQRALELYDECYKEAESTDAILNREPELRSAFLAHASTQCINAQAEILQNEARVGRRVYRGASDWLEYTMKTAIEVKNRIQLADSNDVGVGKRYWIWRDDQKLLKEIQVAHSVQELIKKCCDLEVLIDTKQFKMHLKIVRSRQKVQLYM